MHYHAQNDFWRQEGKNLEDSTSSSASNVGLPRSGFTVQNLQGIVVIKDYDMYYNLRDDLAQHLWEEKM